MEYEVVEDGRELALTILRSTGLISRSAHAYRESPAGPEIEIPDAQCRGPWGIGFALYPHDGAWHEGVLGVLEQYLHPFLIAPGQALDGPTSRSGLSSAARNRPVRAQAPRPTPRGPRGLRASGAGCREIRRGRARSPPVGDPLARATGANGRRRRPALRKAELAAGNGHGGAADLDLLDLFGRALDTGEQRGRTPDLGALRDLDLVAEPDASMARQVHGERAGRRTGGEVLGNAVARANIRVFHRDPEPAKQLIPSTAGRSARAPKFGRRAATACSDGSAT